MSEHDIAKEAGEEHRTAGGETPAGAPVLPLPTATLPSRARRLLDTAVAGQTRLGHSYLGAGHWLAALLQRHRAMADELVSTGAVEAGSAPPFPALVTEAGSPLPEAQVAEAALARARQAGRDAARERDIAAVILAANGYPVPESGSVCPGSLPDGQGTRPALVLPGAPGARSRTRPRPNAAASAGTSHRPTPTLDALGRDLTREARLGRLAPFIGREDELQSLIEILCRRTKRNPLLIGPAGVGKTALVEQLAQRLAAGDVPPPLRGRRLVALETGALIAGTGYVGALEKRVRALLTEAREGVLLFIDELHAIVGAGASQVDRTDLAALLKPALARGELACIGATTDQEYRIHLQPDAALERRFQPLRLYPLSPELTLRALHAVRDQLASVQGVQIPDEVLAWLVEASAELLPARSFPDKAIDLLEQCFARALARGWREVSLVQAAEVVRVATGQPRAIPSRLDRLERELSRRGLLAPELAAAWTARLRVTLPGLDLESGRPNGVLLALGFSTERLDALVRTIAEVLFDDAERHVDLDFGQFREPHQLSGLLGAAPGYVGYGEWRPLHGLTQMPWSVVSCRGLAACHPEVRGVLAEALARGYFVDGSGQRAYLGDAVVVLSADLPPGSSRTLGFRAAGATPARRIAELVIGPELLPWCDVICPSYPSAQLSPQAGRTAQCVRYLQRLADRYRAYGIHLSWEPALPAWLARQGDEEQAGHPGLEGVRERMLGRMVETEVSHVLGPLLSEVAGALRDRASPDGASRDNPGLQVRLGVADETLCVHSTAKDGAESRERMAEGWRQHAKRAPTNVQSHWSSKHRRSKRVSRKWRDG